MSKYSTEQAAHIAVVIGFILSFFKINIGTEELTIFITSVLIVGGSVYGWIKRHQRGDLRISGFRKIPL